MTNSLLESADEREVNDIEGIKGKAGVVQLNNWTIVDGQDTTRLGYQLYAVPRMHKEPPKPKGRITEKLYSQSVHPIYDTVWELK